MRPARAITDRCEVCGEEAGQPCLTTSGRVSDLHALPVRRRWVRLGRLEVEVPYESPARRAHHGDDR